MKILMYFIFVAYINPRKNTETVFNHSKQVVRAKHSTIRLGFELPKIKYFHIYRQKSTKIQSTIDKKCEIISAKADIIAQFLSIVVTKPTIMRSVLFLSVHFSSTSSLIQDFSLFLQSMIGLSRYSSNLFAFLKSNILLQFD